MVIKKYRLIKDDRGGIRDGERHDEESPMRLLVLHQSLAIKANQGYHRDKGKNISKTGMCISKTTII